MMKLHSAYDTISDPDKRRAYDVKWIRIRDTLRSEQESTRRQTEATAAENKRAAEEKAKKQQEDNARHERLRNLGSLKSGYDSGIFEFNGVIRKLTAEMKNLQIQDDEDLRKKKKQNSWWAYLSSPIFGKMGETDEEKQTREIGRLHRLASKNIKGNELHQKQVDLQRLQDALQNVNIKIAAEKNRLEDEALAQMRLDQEARYRAQREMREKMAKIQREEAERIVKEAREARAAQEAQEAQERARKVATAQRCRREAEERAAEAIRTAQKSRNNFSEPAPWSYNPSGASVPTKKTCRHDKYWAKIEESQLCSDCHALQRRFVFQCPGCRMIACASCRRALRGEKAKSYNSDRQYGFDRDNNHYTDISNYDYD